LDLSFAHFVKDVGALIDLDLTTLEVDINPSQPAQLARPQATEDCNQDQRSPLIWSSGDDCLKFRLRRRNRSGIVAIRKVQIKASGRVNRRQPSATGFAEDSAERLNNPSNHFRRTSFVS
jgi:hypothetical protein